MQLNSSISAVVTGGASGLGYACVEALRQAGVKVAIFDLNEDRGAVAAKETGAVFVKADVSNEESVAAGFAKARGANNQERILINCAGIGAALKTVSRDRETGALKMHPLDIFQRIIGVNLAGTFRCVAHAATGMASLEPLADGDRGVIIMTASVAAVDGQIGQAAYSASKGGVVGMTLPIARDLSAEGIRVNTILPGIFHTPLLASLPEKAQQSLAASVPYPKRLGQPSEYASLALEMIRNGYFNGEHVRLDGAIRMAPR